MSGAPELSPDLSVSARTCLLGPWPVYVPGPARQGPVDPCALDALAAAGLAYERRNFAKSEWRLSPRGRRLRAVMLDLCPECEQPLKGRCHSWCPEGARRASA